MTQATTRVHFNNVKRQKVCIQAGDRQRKVYHQNMQKDAVCACVSDGEKHRRRATQNSLSTN